MTDKIWKDSEKTDRYELVCGDSLERLKQIPSNYITAIVTDPPYGLGKEPEALEMLRDWILEGHHEVKGKGFMNKDWDSFVPQPNLWKECLRVLKPGGYLLSFAGTRTQDLVGLGLRIAGFEIRDEISWVYSQGFPKSLNVVKALIKTTEDGKEESASSQTVNQFSKLGTALKPAHEPIIVARKPLIGTVVENMLEYGTGALNIDDCRIHGSRKQATAGLRTVEDGKGWGVGTGGNSYIKGTGAVFTEEGRWPANFIHDGSEEVLNLFPETKKNNVKSLSTARFFYCAKATKQDRDDGLEDFSDNVEILTTGKGLGNCLPSCPIHNCGLPSGRNYYRCGCSQVYNASQPTRRTFKKNFHNTVKPTNLMRWLCRLVTPIGGIVLDPFMGSGSTGKAAMIEGFNFIGIDKEPDYLKLSAARIKSAMLQTTKQGLTDD